MRHFGSLPSSLHLTSSDFHIFCYFKHHLGINDYNDNEVVKTADITWLSVQESSFLKEDIRNTIVRHDKCLKNMAAMLKNRQTYVESEKKLVCENFL